LYNLETQKGKIIQKCISVVYIVVSSVYRLVHRHQVIEFVSPRVVHQPTTLVSRAGFKGGGRDRGTRPSTIRESPTIMFNSRRYIARF